jgi:hypothetical protein
VLFIVISLNIFVGPFSLHPAAAGRRPPTVVIYERSVWITQLRQ